MRFVSEVDFPTLVSEGGTGWVRPKPERVAGEQKLVAQRLLHPLGSPAPEEWGSGEGSSGPRLFRRSVELVDHAAVSNISSSFFFAARAQPCHLGILIWRPWR